MPHPREAIFDVLQAQRQKRLDLERRADLERQWAQYEEANDRAHASYRPDPRTRK